MFARMARCPGKPPYEDYYSSRAAWKDADDRLRSMPPLLEPGGRFYDPQICRDADRYFRNIADIDIDASVVERWRETIEESTNPTEAVKAMCLALGAVAAGSTALPKEYVYTHKGRFDENYGREIQLGHPAVLVFLVEMDFDAMRHAPRAEAIRESARQYYRAAVISTAVEATLQSVGCAAKAHYDAHYDLILPPLAVESGLGELGRNNILVAAGYGSRVRIGAVSTDFPLESDSPVDLGVDSFCAICKKCADNCPSRALSAGSKESIRGILKYPTNERRCYGYWRTVGTDCGICMSVCPFSHRASTFHNFVRFLVRLTPRIHRLALFFDDVLYGRVWKPMESEPSE